MSHTVGPWLVDKTGHVSAAEFYKPSPFTSVEGVEHPDHMGGIVALVYGCGGANQKDNARLIAAAPELLVACKEALQALIGHDQRDLCNQLNTAIAKVEGQS